VIYAIASDSKSITTVKQATLEEGKEWETFVEQLPEKECRWGVYDLEYDQGEGKRNKLCFVMWWVAGCGALRWTRQTLIHAAIVCIRSPDDAPIRQKMMYASSKDAIRKQLVGISTEIQATGYDEITFDSG
jgi:cofilin